MQRYSDIICYTTLICDYGLLCLDWRDICDGVQQCMSGYDEENCDRLEFNECEDDEYRCVNGMCIPDEYFLDGEYDCLDLTDEKQLFKDTKCTFQPASYECDDRMCLRSYWSCGDGQCIENRRDFFTSFPKCHSLRERYHVCELFNDGSVWTLPNGKCYQSSEYEEVLIQNRTDSEKCLYFIKCALSQGGEKNCPCGRDLSCINQVENPCSSLIIQYPNGAIMGRYVFHFYNDMRDWSEKMPDAIVVNGTIKCRGYMAGRHMILSYPFGFELNKVEVNLCVSTVHIPVSTNIGYDKYCHNNSRTFNNRSYNFIDICKLSRDCISTYRIQDGYPDCYNDEDEKKDAQFPNSCLNIQRHRFRCSNEQSSCLPAQKLGDESHDCRNDRDERWIEEGIMLSKLVCNIESKNDCEFIRKYVEASGKLDANNSFDRQLKSTKISFHAFCDTFWNWNSAKDEDIELCQKWWTCPENQWQCRSGQCIKIEWVLDGEWDCVDASDEQGLLVSRDKFFLRNLGIVNFEELRNKFYTLYKKQPFWNLCNLSVEYPCFRANVLDSLNITQNRPCINLHRIGDGHVDCAGGLDERNNLKYRLLPVMLGYCFQCSLAEECIPYWSHCPAQCDNNRVQCHGYQQAPHCSERFDVMCLNGVCVKKGWCDQHFDCSHGEDELLCINQERFASTAPHQSYRQEKELSIRTTKQKFQLPQLPIDTSGNKVTNKAVSIVQNRSTTTSFPDKVHSSISYYCNRGIGVHLYNGLIVCFCPPQYYGDKCQFHNDRIIFLFHLNLSQSIYAESNDLKTVLKLLIIFMNETQPLMIESFQMQVTDEIIIPRKKLLQLFYSRSNASLHHKRARYFNRSDIINKHPYSVRIEAYELNLSQKPRPVGVWLYPIYFDFLPSFRLAKVLHLTKPNTMKNPCFSNPCNPQQECHQILNQNSTYVCLCRPNFKGHNCSIIDEMCERGFCSLNSLCKPTYRGLLSDNERPYCICPLKEIGHRCDLIHDKCDPNPCQNYGTCLPTAKPHRFICICDDYHYGDECQLEKRSVRLSIKNSPSHRAAVVQYFDINFVSLDLFLVHQRVYVNLPDLLHYFYDEKIAPGITVVKLYSNTQSEIYLISIRINVESINGTTELSENNRCAHVQTLFPMKEEISPIKYHYLCIQNLSLLCFMDESYLCICDKNHSRSECFGYDYSVDQCSSCLAGGQCLKEDQLKSDFLCLCPRCYYGSLCQFSIEGISFTLDSLIIQISRIIQIIYFVLALLFFVIGGVTNYASIVTFKRPNLRKSSISIYMLTFSLIGQCSLLSLLMKIILILFDSLMNDISCKIISFMLSVSGRCLFWLTSWIAIERVCYLLFPYATVLKNPRVATIITFSTLLVVAIMHVHELLSYMQMTDQSGKTACVLDFPLKLRTYDRIAVFIHYIIPFCVQVLSITILIILAARSRSRTGNNHDTFIKYLKQQFKRQKELYIPPLVAVLSGLPQTILAFNFACLELVIWQQHALLIAYFLSFGPQLLGFVLFVLPSTNYMKEFRATQLSKTTLFQWVLFDKKNQTTTTTK